MKVAAEKQLHRRTFVSVLRLCAAAVVLLITKARAVVRRIFASPISAWFLRAWLGSVVEDYD